jgi:hypothetical protein
VQPPCGTACGVGLSETLLGKAMPGRRFNEICKVRYQEQQIDGETPLVLASISPADVGDREHPRGRPECASVRCNRWWAAILVCRSVGMCRLVGWREWNT